MLCLSSHKSVFILSACCLLGCFWSCSKEVEVFKATESTVKEVVDEQLKDKEWHDELEAPDDFKLELTEIDAPLPAGCLAVLPARGVYPEYKDLNNIDCLNKTTDDIFFIQSEDDTMVPYRIALEVVESIDNPHIKKLKMSGRKHNPNYTDASIQYMNEVFGTYYSLLREKKIKTDADKIDYFKDVSLAKLVEQDEQLFDQIAQFLN